MQLHSKSIRQTPVWHRSAGFAPSVTTKQPGLQELGAQTFCSKLCPTPSSSGAQAGEQELGSHSTHTAKDGLPGVKSGHLSLNKYPFTCSHLCAVVNMNQEFCAVHSFFILILPINLFWKTILQRNVYFCFNWKVLQSNWRPVIQRV